MDDCELRFRVNARAGDSHRFVLLADGRIQQRASNPDGTLGAVLAEGSAPRALSERVLTAARQVLPSEAAEPTDVTGPAGSLKLELVEWGLSRGATFGRDVGGEMVMIRKLLKLAVTLCGTRSELRGVEEIIPRPVPFPPKHPPRPDDASRTRWLGELAALLHGACTYDSPVAFLHSAPRDVCVESASGGHDRHYGSFVLKPGMEALAFCQALGIDEPLAMSGDTPSEIWSIHVATRLEPGRRFTSPKPLGDEALYPPNFRAQDIYKLRPCEPCNVSSVLVAQYASIDRRRG
jgi:hypothetical protein